MLNEELHLTTSAYGTLLVCGRERTGTIELGLSLVCVTEYDSLDMFMSYLLMFCTWYPKREVQMNSNLNLQLLRVTKKLKFAFALQAQEGTQ